MLPLGLLNIAVHKPVMVELKSGETFNGILCNCDFWMNCNLKDVIVTSADGERFWKMTECHIRGLNVKYIRIPDELLETAKEENAKRKQQQNRPKSGGQRRGDHSGRGSRGGRGGRGGQQSRGESRS